jgi:hypothetical protein
MQMKHFSLFALLMAALTMTGCGRRADHHFVAQTHPVDSNDSTLYGLVCDGSNDSILVYLPDPYDGSDPDTLDILNATRQHQVFGRMQVGDRVAIMRDTVGRNRASLVIVTQDLQQQWCYKVKPRIRRRAELVNDSVGLTYWELPDSLQEQLMAEREYGFTLKADSIAMPVGMRQVSADEGSPVEYPPLKRYRQWYISNGRLLLVETSLDSLGNLMPVAMDTAQLVELTPDTLVLRMADGLHGYYSKKE